MQQIVQMASELYMIALCLLLGPADQREIRIDQVSSRGLMDSMIVQRTDQGFAVHNERSGQRIPFVTIDRQKEKPSVFIAKGPNGQQEVIDLSTEVAKLETVNARRQGKQVLKTQRGSEIQIARSGSIQYLNETGADRTYVVHYDERLTAKAGSTNAVETITRVYALKYAEAKPVSEIVKPILGESGQVAADERTHALVVTTSSDLQARIAELVKYLDVKVERSARGATLLP